MQVRLFEKGTEPPPSSQGVVEDISTEHIPLPGDVIQLEGRNAEVIRRFRVVSRLFRVVPGSTEIALEVEPVA
jgi:hypothetical protein